MVALAVAVGIAPPNPGPVGAWVVPVAVVAVVRSWPVVPMLNDPGQREREARKSPIGPPVALWAVPVAVPVWATATLWGALNLPPVVATPNLQAPRWLVGHWLPPPWLTPPL